MIIRNIIRAAVIAAALSACSNQYETVSPELQANMLADLRAGKLTQACFNKCYLTWYTQIDAIHALDIAENWKDLAVRVMQIGYGNDAAYYYLGQAAQGLGYHQAAITYYSQAYRLTTGPDLTLTCQNAHWQGDNPCRGVDIASVIPVLIQASRDALAQQAAAAAAARRHRRSNVQPASAGPGWAAPPPPGAPASDAGGPGWAAPPPAAPAGAGPGWAAPPPAH